MSNFLFDIIILNNDWKIDDKTKVDEILNKVDSKLNDGFSKIYQKIEKFLQKLFKN